MPRLSVSSALVLAALFSAATATHAKELRFESAFATPKPASVHYEARFVARDGSEQTVEAWRDGEARVRRRTQGALEIYAVREANSAEYDLTVLDLRRKLLTRIDRANLFRLGNFTEWFDLAHGLRHPKGDYRVARGTAPMAAERPIAACTWYDLKQQGRASHVCWDARSQLPLLIVDAQDRAVWCVTRLDLGPVSPDVFVYEARDYIVNDANRDMERD